MESFPATPGPQLEYIKDQIVSSDYLLIILGARYGHVSHNGKSFTELEFEYAVEQNIPVLAFPIADPSDVAVSHTDRSDKSARLLKAFREKLMEKRICRLWKDKAELASAAGQALRYAEQRNPRPGWHRSDTSDLSIVLDENRSLTARLGTAESGLQKTESKTDIESRSFKSALFRKRVFSYDSNDEQKEGSISYADILYHIRLDEDLNFNKINEGAAYFITDGQDISDVAVYSGITDGFILFCQRYSIIELQYKEGSPRIRHGPNWLIAHRMARNAD
jgi:hypothetical protein